MLALPVLALHQAGVRLCVIVCGATLVSTVTYGSYAIDKRRARTGAWRLSEAFLHLLELLGGWPGAWIAQQRLRHKCSKLSYQFVFWLIISIHQFAALDWLQHGRWSQMLISKATMVLKG
ncbi:MAG: DUF1294 domain-containing protein [Verrucomicrobiaceae bacterium]|nr:DUF1294 domain-containing protein [Verrucomicrobiaceae bacterium]